MFWAGPGMAVGYFSFQPVDDVYSGAPKEGGPPNKEPIVILIMVVVVVVVGPPWVPWGGPYSPGRRCSLGLPVGWLQQVTQSTL